MRRKTILTTAALLAVAAAPAYGDPTPWENLRTPGPVDAGEQRGSDGEARPYVLQRDYGSPDAVDGEARPYVLQRDYGSPDAVDGEARPDVLQRDYGSPDVVDAARDLPPVQIPAPVVASAEPPSGFDWSDAGLGAAGMLALLSIAAGSALLLTGRKRRNPARVATH